MATPVVSVVIPTYNRAHVLSRALRSVATQTYTDYEVLVVDDGSTDATEGVVAGFTQQLPDRVKYIKVDRNRGAAAARNRGVRAARGTYVALLDADDEWRPMKLEKQVAHFATVPPEVGLITTRYVLFDRSGRRRSENPPHPKEGDISDSMVDFIEGTEEIVGIFSTLMFRRFVFERVGGLDEALPCWEDADFYFRAARQFHFRFLPEALTLKHESADSISYNWSVEAAGVHLFWRKYREHVGSRPQFRRYIARHQHGAAVQACLAGDLREGRRLFRQSLAIWPSQWHPAAHLAMSFAGAKAYAGMWSMGQRLRKSAGRAA